MNQKTNQPAPTPFAPFAPPPPPMFEGQILPAAPAPEAPAAKRKRPSTKKVKPAKKVASEARAPKASQPKRRKPARDRHAVGEAKPVPAKRKARGAPKGKRAPKFELQTILKIAAGLKEADQKLFEAMLGELSATPKAARRRVLAALGHVFG